MSVLAVPKNNNKSGLNALEVASSEASPLSSPLNAMANFPAYIPAQNPISKPTLLVKGAPETILERCKFYRFYNGIGSTPEKGFLNGLMKDKLLKHTSRWAQEKAHRLIAFAVVDEMQPLEAYDVNQTSNYADYEVESVRSISLIANVLLVLHDLYWDCRYAGST
jgi:magnesium-transporting ATPase (P-type)